MNERQRELLDMLQEEAAEVIQEASKTKRHGWNSHHPGDATQTTNRARLAKEIQDFLTVLSLLKEEGVFQNFIIRLDSTDELRKMKLHFTHHQR